MTQLIWKTLSGRPVKTTIEEEVASLATRARLVGEDFRVCIGTDSQVKGNDIHFATVIVFLRMGRGAVIYARKQQLRRRMTVRQRMIEEVNRSVEVAIALQPLLTTLQISFEVHADINTQPCFRSQEALHEAAGYIRGMGFEFRAKPYAFASSSCANRLVQ
jgi:predicted RNase H-related nuclease YkuK (DUF458 family)